MDNIINNTLSSHPQSIMAKHQISLQVGEAFKHNNTGNIIESPPQQTHNDVLHPRENTG